MSVSKKKIGNDPEKYFLIDHIQIAALTAMKHVAGQLGVTMGVAVILVENKYGNNSGLSRYASVNIGFSTKDINYFGRSAGMIAVMKDTGVNSGLIIDVKNGESSLKGGLLRMEKDHMIYVAFAGRCLEEINLEVARVGMAMLFPEEARG